MSPVRYVLHEAARALRGSDLDAALKLYDRAIERGNNTCYSYRERGTLKIELGDYMEGLEDMRTALAIDPNNEFMLVLGRAVSAARRGPPEFMAGLEDLADEALEKSSDKALAYANRGRLFSDLGDVERDQTEFEHAVRLGPENPVVWRIWGQACITDGRLQEAMEKFARADELGAIELWSDWSRLAVKASHKGQFTIARDSSSEWIRLDAENTEAYRRRAAAHFHLQDYAAALADCRQAAALKTGDPGIPISLSVQQIANCPDPEFPQQLVELMEENFSRPEIDVAKGRSHLRKLLAEMGR